MGMQATDDRLLAHELAELIDKVMVNEIAGYDVQQQLGLHMESWKQSGGSKEGRSLIQKSQGMVGMVNASQRDGAMRAHAYSELTEFKQQLRRMAASRE